MPVRVDTRVSLQLEAQPASDFGLAVGTTLAVNAAAAWIDFQTVVSKSMAASISDHDDVAPGQTVAPSTTHCNIGDGTEPG